MPIPRNNTRNLNRNKVAVLIPYFGRQRLSVSIDSLCHSLSTSQSIYKCLLKDFGTHVTSWLLRLRHQRCRSRNACSVREKALTCHCLFCLFLPRQQTGSYFICSYSGRNAIMSSMTRRVSLLRKMPLRRGVIRLSMSIVLDAAFC